MKVNAYAKINLMLDVGEKRPDGYHSVKMIMQTVSLCDELEIKPTAGGIFVSGSDADMPRDEGNLAYRAAEAFFKESGLSGGAEIYIKKKIPMCAGLAGGSSDTAAVLEGLNALFGSPLGTRELMRTGAQIGADVPFCLLKGTALAEGIGEILTPLPPLGEHTVLIVKPPIAVSTPWAYGALDRTQITHPDVDAAAELIKTSDYRTLWQGLENVFEAAVFEVYPEIGEIKRQLKAFGAEAALMSGSGSAVFGIFGDEGAARTAYDNFLIKYKETFLTKTFNV